MENRYQAPNKKEITHTVSKKQFHEWDCFLRRVFAAVLRRAADELLRLRLPTPIIVSAGTCFLPALKTFRRSA